MVVVVLRDCVWTWAGGREKLCEGGEEQRTLKGMDITRRFGFVVEESGHGGEMKEETIKE